MGTRVEFHMDPSPRQKTPGFRDFKKGKSKEWIMKSCWVCLLLTTVFFARAQDSQLTEVSGEVYDMLGKPIANAVVVYTDVEHGGSTAHLTHLNGREPASWLPRRRHAIQNNPHARRPG